MNENLSDSRLFVVSWNTTKMCNLRCVHCYLDATYLDGKVKDELSTEEGYKLIDKIHSINPNAVLILTGGEPLLREDIFKLGKYAADKGLMPVLGTNGTLIDDIVAQRLIEHDIKGIGVSIDSMKDKLHDEFRGVAGALKNTIRGIEIAKKHKIEFQVQTTVTKQNIDEIADIVEFAYSMGCRAYNLFFLVCTGRGQKLTDITPKDYELALKNLVALEDKYNGKMVIKAKCAPHYKRVAYQINSDDGIKGYKSDCLGGIHYCRVTSEGDITSCPYMPMSVGNVRKDDFVSLWKGAEVFNNMRGKALKGKCNECEFKVICGGCRARAYSSNNDYMTDDPWCEYTPNPDAKVMIKPKKEDDYWVDEECKLVWSEDAQKRLQTIPKFIRNMVTKGVERYARSKGYKVITPDIMKESREKGGGMAPHKF